MRPRLLFGTPIFTVVLTVTAFISTGCNRGITPGTLRFSHFWSEPSQRALMDSLLQGFHKIHPEIPVEVTELSWSDGKTKLMVGFNAETAPDVIELGSDWVAQFSSSGVLEDLGSTSLKDRFTAASHYSLESGMWKGKYYAVPWLLDTRVMFLNDDLLEKASQNTMNTKWDWTAMRTLGEAVNRSGNAAGLGVNGADQHRLYKKFLPYVWSNGGDIFDTAGNPTFDRPENIEALQYYSDQQNAGQVGTQKDLDDQFKRGTLAIWFSGSWMLGPMKKAPFKWHTMIVPGNHGHPGISFAGGEYLAINNKSQMKKQAEIFLDYVTSAGPELRFAKAVNMYPATEVLQTDSFYLQRREGPVFTQQMKQARMTSVIPQWLDVEAILEDEVSRVLYKKSTASEAMKSAQSRVKELLAQP